ncbi:MFS transporter [Evansella cellulosilytica]|uniref:Major facilitator superfamily MFS_1 n=1 Tax=Evansella cellulosilytica (strain ATCC 21833 / DSM 2522 / FERM P-1141 / JCM 9156 / N-4) TaxID=649639 RepID=E6TQF4_EVAC2|nr:MFS transporter [Evansella cellulosilytica]ADU29332.1 major facilitator superfamily MFS_1 [Evansella cellulosilytica DSM 2522]
MKAAIDDKVKEQAENSGKSLWKNGQFLLLLSGSSISNLTFYIFTLALPIIIYDLTQSTFAMGTMRGIEFLPNLLLAIFIGVLVDRFNRKFVLLSAASVQALCIFVIIVFLMSSSIQLWHLYLFGFILYTAGYTFGNAYHTVLPLIVEKDQLTSANAIISFIRTTVSLVGPAFAGFILVAINYMYGLSITLVGLLLLLLFTSFLSIPHRKKPEVLNEKNSIFSDIKEGWNSLIENRELWNLTIMVLLSNIASASTLAVLIFFALDVMQVAEVQIGFILSSSAVGGLLAAMIAKKIVRWIKRGPLFLIALGLESIGYVILFLAMDWYWLAVGMFFNGFTGGLINIHYFTLRQETTPNHLLGRVAGTSSTIMKLAVPFAFIGVGALGEVIPVHFIFLGSAVMTGMIILYLIKTPVVKMK